MKIGKIAYLHYFLTALVLGLIFSIHGGAARQTRALAVLFLLDLFGAGVVFICLLGLLGNLLTSIQRNRSQIALHMAVGADTGDILRLVLVDTVLKRAVIPVLLGSICSQLLAVSPVLRLSAAPLSLEGSPGNAALCALAALCFLALGALYPARTAARIPPAQTLKGDS